MKSWDSEDEEREKATGQSIWDGRFDVARALVENVLKSWQDAPPYTDLAQGIVDDPYDGVQAALNERDRLYGQGQLANTSTKELLAELSRRGAQDLVKPTPSPSRPLWLVKNEVGEYLKESTVCGARFDERQRFAMRFTDYGVACRMAKKWGRDNEVVRLCPRTSRPAKGDG